MTRQTVIVDSITLGLMVLVAPLGGLAVRALDRHGASRRVPFKRTLLVLLVLAVSCAPLLLWGIYTVMRGWRFALTCAQTWGVAAVALTSIVVVRLRRPASRAARRHSDG